MTVVFYDEGTADEDECCDVRIDSENIIVNYMDGKERVQYEGSDLGGGHFILNCKAKSGKASLHLPKDGKILEGYWEESGDRGFWRIYLNKDFCNQT